MDIKKYFNSQTKTSIIRIALAQLCVIGYIDYITGYEFALALFYMAPIMLVSWYADRNTGLYFSFLSSLVMFAADYEAGIVLQNYLIEFWNFSMRLGFFTVTVFLIAKVRYELEEHIKLVNSLKESMNEIRKLSGLLPICASCKRIRDEEGYWNQLEFYISEHSEAQFSHGICSECAKKLYPDQYNRVWDKEDKYRQ